MLVDVSKWFTMVCCIIRSKVRSRLRAFDSLNYFHFQNLSPPPFTMAVGKWPRIVELEHNISMCLGQIFYICLSFLCHVTLKFELYIRLSTKFPDFSEIWYVCSDARRYAVWTDLRSRSRSRALESLNFCHFQMCLLRRLRWYSCSGKWPRILKLEHSV